MKTFVAVIFFIAGSFLCAQNNSEKDFRNLIERFYQEVYSETDSTRLEKFLTDDFIQFEDGKVFNQDSLRVVIKNLIQQFESEQNNDRNLERLNSFEFLKSNSDENSGWISYRNSAEFKLDGIRIAEIKWLGTAQFIRTSEGWKIAFIHNTLIREN
ncbi:MAG: nuclear transport factor 2 family protein [Flavobacteriaceae bacterium]|jgi:hypothetical protein|nr:nuclear transport factor 2 family protein [Flavobacteriaceae bacterium]